MRQGRTGKSAGRSRGEVNEIIGQLEQLSAQNGQRPDVVTLKRECFQKLIRYMTAGIDMSSAFVPATKCVALSKFDLPLKKMLYLYLRSAARLNEAVALLVVQTMLNDCKDADPTVRGLAVRSMCSLGVPDLMENVFSAVDRGLVDPHSYVREVSVIGVLKCLHQDAAGTRLRGLLDRVRAMLSSDPDPQVVANCLYVLRQGKALEGAVTRTLAVSLLNRIRTFSDWAQCLVLEVLLERYRPGSEAERFDMLEVLDFGLNHTNSAVVLATAKLFLHFTANYPEQYGKVLDTIKGPLQTLLLGREPEIVFAALSNLLVLAQRHPQSFADLTPDLFCRPEDPSYLKSLKLEAMVAAAAPSNAYDAAEECSQYARDSDPVVARAAVRAVAHIAVKVPEVDGILDRLLMFLGHARAEVASEALAAMADVLRRFPDAAVACVPVVAGVEAAALEQPAARAAYCWVLGEFGERVQEAPYVLEGMVGRWGEEPAEVKLALLSATAKLFFKRPPECRPALGAVLAFGIADPDFAVHDRALLYYRLLQSGGASAARSIIAAPRPLVSSFEEAAPLEVRDRIFDEWNSLSTVYQAPAATFLDLGEEERAAAVEPIGFGGEGVDESTSGEADGGTALLLDLDGDSDKAESVSAAPASALESSPGEDLLLSLNGLSSGNGGGLAPAAPMQQPPAPSQQQQSPLDMLGDLLGGSSAGGMAAPPPMRATTAAAAPWPSAGGGLGNGLDDLLGGFSEPASQPQQQQQQQQQQAVSVELVSQPAITPQDFQASWAAWSAESFQLPLTPPAVGAVQSRGHRDFVEHVKQANILSFATPKEGSAPPYRFLFHAQRAAGAAGGAHVLAQVTVSTAPPAAEAVIKSDDAAARQYVAEMIQNLLLSL